MTRRGRAASALLLICLCAAVRLHAGGLSWKDIVSAAEKNNPELRSARLAVDSSRAKVGAAQSDFFPQLSGGGSYAKSDSGPGAGSQNEYAMNLTAQQTVFSGFRTKAGVDAAKAQLEGARAGLSAVESRIFNDLRSAYLSVLFAQENINLLKKIRDRREGNKKLIELRYEGGRENKGVLLRANAQWSQAKFEVEQAERSLRVARKNLAQAMGLNGTLAGAVTGSFDVKRDGGTPDFAALAQQTPDYLQSLHSLEAARASLTQSRSDYFPSLSLSGTGRRRGADFPPDNDSWNVGASVSYAFFSGSRDYFGVKGSKAEAGKAAADLESRRRRIELSLEDAYAALEDAAGQARIQEQFLEASEERARIARAQYNNGLISYQDWDLIETDLTNSQKQMLQSLRNAALAESAWLQAQGKGLNALP